MVFVVHFSVVLLLFVSHCLGMVLLHGVCFFGDDHAILVKKNKNFEKPQRRMGTGDSVPQITCTRPKLMNTLTTPPYGRPRQPRGGNKHI